MNGMGYLLVISVSAGLAAFFPRVCESAWKRVSLLFGRAVRREKRSLLLLSLVVFALLLFFALGVFHNYPLSGDENCGIFLAKCFLMGKTYVSLHPMHAFFRSSHVGEKDGKKFSVYPPAWPLLLAVGLALGVPWAVNPLLSVAALWLLYAIGRSWYDREVAAGAVLATAGSAFYLHNGASYYSHAFAFFFLLLFVWFFDRLWSTRRSAYAFACGFAVGTAFAARPLTALAFAAPFGFYLVWQTTGAKRFSWRAMGYAALGVAIPVSLFMAFNASISGNPLVPPLQYYYGHERLGFIPGHSVSNGLRLTADRLADYVRWTPPFLFPIFLVSLFCRRHSRWEHLMFLVAVYLAAGYFLYYGDGGNRYGPRFFYEALGFVMLVAVARARDLYRTLSEGFYKRWVRSGVLCGALGHLIVTAALAWNYHVILWERSSLEREIRARELGNSIVFVRDWIGTRAPTFPTDTLRNAPDLSDSVLLANDFGAENKTLKEAFPDRRFFVATYDRQKNQLHLDEATWKA